MNAPDPVHPLLVAHAALDAADRLVEADAALLDLQRRAGGDLGEPLAVAPLATVARLARRLGIAVTRQVVVADADGTSDLEARAEPEGERLRLTVSGRRDRADADDAPGDDHRRADSLPADADWHWEVDAALRLTRIAADAGRRHGFDAVALLGEPLTTLFDLAGMAGEQSLIDAVARGRPITACPARLRPGTGDGAGVTLSAVPRLDGGGRFAGFSGAVREGLPSASAGATTTLPEVFATGLDKALRRPLAQIVANADSIHEATEGPIAPDYAGYAADIAHAGRHLMSLVDDLVDLQAVERPGFVTAHDPIDLADVARRAAGLLGVRAADAGVAIERPPAARAVRATGDFRRALQILVNLTGNAVRYAPRGSIVLIGVASDGGVARVSVADEGKGIATADQARVFEKFERVDPSEPGGSGLGLYIARRLARAMGGDLTLESAPGEGARFTLTLPAGEPPRDQDQH